MIQKLPLVPPSQAPRPWADQPVLTVLPSFVVAPLPIAEKLRHAHDDLQKTVQQLETAIAHPQQRVYLKRLYVNHLHVQLQTLDGILKESIEILAEADRQTDRQRNLQHNHPNTDRPTRTAARAEVIPDTTLQEIRSLFLGITAALETVENWNP